MDERDEMARLQARVSRLTDQVKLLVRTEQRLYHIQRESETQLRRIEALSSFALYASDAEAPEGVLRNALELILALFGFEQAVAFVGDGSHFRAECAVGAPGRVYDAEERVAELGTIEVGEELPFVARSFEVGDTSLLGALEPLLEACERAFSAPHADVAEVCAVLCVPLRSREGAVLGVLVARKFAGDHSHAERAHGVADRPLLALTARHVESAFENARLRSTLAKSEGRMRAVMDALPEAVFVVSDGLVVYANDPARRFTGSADNDEFIGAPFAPLLVKEERASTEAAIERVAAGGPPMRLLAQRWVGTDDEPLAVDTALVGFLFDERPAVVVVADDRDERRRMRTKLIQTDRLATVGALAAGVAHEINNPLAFIMLNLERLRRGQVEPDVLARAAGSAYDGAARIRAIVADLKTFSRVEDGSFEVLDINDVLESVLAMAANEVRYRAVIVRDFAPEAYVLGNEGRLAQVFLNLLVNAAHAIPEGAVEQNQITVCSCVEDACVIVEVIDTGVGIAPETFPRLFDPFYSTKPPGEGTGLGLSISRNIIEGHGGRISVESAVDAGTRFVVQLPRATRRSEPAQAEVEPERTPGRRILVVDDEPALRAVLGGMLEEDNEVVTAASGAEALEILATDRAFDVILCDLMMPQVSGADVYEWMEASATELTARTIFMTGGVFTPRGRDLLARLRNPVLAKPFTQRDLFVALEARDKASG